MKINSIEKCLRIFDLLSKNMGGLRILDISRELDMPTSSIHHILSTLLPHNYVIQDPETKKYALGLRFVDISQRILDSFDIRPLAKPHLRKLHDACGETVHLAVFRNKKVVYIDKIGAAEGLSLVTYVGFATEPHGASGGKVLISELSEPEIRDIYPSGRMKKYGEKTITSVKVLLEELAKIREQGYALDDEEYYEGVRCVAAPIKVGGKIIAAVSITGSIFTMTMERIERELIPMVRQAGEGISRAVS